MQDKQFAQWHKQKLQIQKSNSLSYFREGQLWWIALGQNIGDEENGKGDVFSRPVLILRKFNKSLFYGLPLSTSLKQGKFYYALDVQGRANIILLSQMRAYDSKRMISKLGVISLREMKLIKKCLIGLINGR